jgi:hypothetical protein
LWHVVSKLWVGTETAPDEVDEGDEPPVEVVVVASDEGDKVGGPASTVVSLPLMVVSISAEDGPAVVEVAVVVACRGATAPARTPLAMMKRVKRTEVTAMAKRAYSLL